MQKPIEQKYMRLNLGVQSVSTYKAKVQKICMGVSDQVSIR
jgi:hypothetical protein